MSTNPARVTQLTLAPRLETRRLVLRGHVLADLEDCVSLWEDAEVTRFIGGSPATPQESWFRLLRYVGHWTLLGHGYWVIEEKSSGRYAGEIGFSDSQRDIEPSLSGMPESGWALFPWAQGQGYASEALERVLAWGDETLGGRTTCCIISPQNLPSLRVAQKNGYVEAARTTYGDEPILVFQR